MARPKTKPGTPGVPPHKTPPAPAAVPPLNPGAARWQRTVRYGWDKGGARGGKR